MFTLQLVVCLLLDTFCPDLNWNCLVLMNIHIYIGICMNYYFLGLQLVYIKPIVILLNMNIMQKTKPKVKVKLFLIIKICLELWLECLNFVSFFLKENPRRNLKIQIRIKNLVHMPKKLHTAKHFLLYVLDILRYYVLYIFHFFFKICRPNMDNKIYLFYDASTLLNLLV